MTVAGKAGADVPRGTAANILSPDDVERLIHEGNSFHLDGLRQSGEPIPVPTAVGTTLVEVPAA